MARPFVTVSIARRYIYVYRDNKGGSVWGERREMIGRGLHWRGKKTCYPNGPWSDVGDIYYAWNQTRASAYIIDSRRSVNYPSYRAERAESTTGFS